MHIKHKKDSSSQNKQTYYLHYNQAGTLRVVTDINHTIIKEITYDTFGNILSDTNQNFKVLFGLAGGLHDRDTNLVHFGYREYDPYTGKWTAKDPIDFSGGDSNLYGYVLGDPVNFIDPEGLYVWTLLTPTEMGSNTMVTVDKNGNKSVYDFDSGKSKPYWNKTKVNCETRKKPNATTSGPKSPATRNPQTKFQKLLVLLEIISRMFK